MLNTFQQGLYSASSEACNKPLLLCGRSQRDKLHSRSFRLVDSSTLHRCITGNHQALSTARLRCEFHKCRS